MNMYELTWQHICASNIKYPVSSSMRTHMKQKRFTMCSAWHFFEFESHACHMPTKYHLVGGSKSKYTKNRWLLYALGDEKTTLHTNPLWWYWCKVGFSH